MHKKPKGNIGRHRKHSGRMNRRALLSGLGAGLALASLAPGRKLLAITPGPTLTPALFRDRGGAEVPVPFDFDKHPKFTIDLKQGLLEGDNKLLVKCDLRGIEKITFYIRDNTVSIMCGTNPPTPRPPKGSGT